jgi:hypothetical protein
VTTTDWRSHDTPEAKAVFADAQYRLDNFSTAEYIASGHDAEVDKKIADRYDRLVLQSAHYEYERQREQDEFELHFPEPVEDTIIEWESGPIWHAARRQDDPEREGGSWWMYGQEQARTWRQLVFEFELHMDNLTYLVPAEEVTQ